MDFVNLRAFWSQYPQFEIYFTKRIDSSNWIDFDSSTWVYLNSREDFLEVRVLTKWLRSIENKRG